MKKIFALIFFATYCCISAQESTDPQKILHQIVKHTEEASLYRKTVDWDTLRPQIYDLGKEAVSVSDLAPAVTYLLKSIGDDHGRVFHNNKILAYYYSDKPKPHLKSMDSDIYRKVQMAQHYPFHAEMIDDSVGYIRIVGLPMGDNEVMSAEIQNEVCRLVKSGAKKWVVDLRYNGGGNMFPMAEGITQIIGNEIVGGSKGLTEAESSVWKVENDDFYYDDQTVQLSDECEIKRLPKVAVLTSFYTASSGEALAVMFKGRERTKFFGSKTLGMVTVTDWHVINENTAMTISVSYYKDRNDEVYTEYVDVDVELPFATEPLSSDDECLNTAIDWLLDD